MTLRLSPTAAGARCPTPPRVRSRGSRRRCAAAARLERAQSRARRRRAHRRRKGQVPLRRARLYLGEYETEPGKFREVDPKDDAVMAYADALFTVQQLQEWAQRYKVSWDVQLHRSRGRVEPSGPDAAARRLLTELSTRRAPRRCSGRAAPTPDQKIPRPPLASSLETYSRESRARAIAVLRGRIADPWPALRGRGRGLSCWPRSQEPTQRSGEGPRRMPASQLAGGRNAARPDEPGSRLI